MLTQQEKDWYLKVPDTQREAASNAYLMSLVAVGLGLPLPILNMIATAIFFFQSRKQTVFVKFHCMQAILSQLMLTVVNAIHFSWLMTILFGSAEFNGKYVGFAAAVIVFNLLEFISNIVGAVKARKGELCSFTFVGPVSKLVYYNQLNKLINDPPPAH